MGIHGWRIPSVLARLEAFLPAMKKANEDLEQRIATEGQASVDIENLGDDAASASGDDEREESDDNDEPQPKKPYIEMVCLIVHLHRSHRLMCPLCHQESWSGRFRSTAGRIFNAN